MIASLDPTCTVSIKSRGHVFVVVFRRNQTAEAKRQIVRWLFDKRMCLGLREGFVLIRELKKIVAREPRFGERVVERTDY